MRLRRFGELRDVLQACEVVAEQKLDGYRLAWNEVGDGTVTRLHTDAQISELLLRLRPIMLEDDPNTFKRVYSVLSRRIDHTAFHTSLKARNRQFSHPVSPMGLAKGTSSDPVLVGTPSPNR